MRASSIHQYGRDEAVERAWPLSHIPVLIDEAEWTAISRRDWSSGRICSRRSWPTSTAKTGWWHGGPPPARARGGQPGMAAPAGRRPPRGGHFLHFCAFDLGRGPDGAWWVLGDRTQAPSGAGFALENRVATGAGLFRPLRRGTCTASPASSAISATCASGPAGQARQPRRHPHAGPAQRNLFRTRLYRPLSRLHAAGRRGPDGRRRPTDGAHRGRAETDQRAVAPAGRRLGGPAGAAQRQSRLGTPGMVSAPCARATSPWSTPWAPGSGNPRPACLHAAHLPSTCSASRAEAAQDRHLVVRAVGRRSASMSLANSTRMTIGPAFSTEAPSMIDDVSAIGGGFTRERGNRWGTGSRHGAG
jgi:hypothetical protein